MQVSRTQMKSYLFDIQKMSSGTDISLSCFYKTFVQREQMIFSTSNMMRREGNLVYSYVWSPYRKTRLMEEFYGPENSMLDEDPDQPRNYSLQVE